MKDKGLVLIKYLSMVMLILATIPFSSDHCERERLTKELLKETLEALPNHLLLAELALILPLQTADCERGFSAQNAIITSKRNRLGEESLNTLMTLKCEGNLQDENLLEKSFSLWRERKQRQIFQKN